MTLFDRGHRVPTFIATLGVATAVLGAPLLYASTSTPGFQPRVQDADDVRAEIDSGRQALREARYADAITHFERALELSPGNADALAGIDEARLMMDQGDLIQETTEDRELLRQQALARFDAAMQNAAQLLGQQQFDQAQQTVLTARVELDQNSNNLNETEYRTRLERASEMLAQIDREETAAQLVEEDRIREDLEQQRREEEIAEERRREEMIQQHLIRVRELQMQRNYEEAMLTIERALILDEDNPIALALRDAIQTAALWDSFLTSERLREFSYSNQFQANRESTIAPYPNFTGPGPRSTTGLMSYPADWPQLSTMRTAGLGGMSVENRVAAQKLEGTAIEHVAAANSFDQVLAYLETATDLDIFADWKSLELIGVRKEDQIDLDLRNVPARVVLERTLEQLGDQFDHPAYAVQDGMLVVSTSDAIRKHVTTEVYDIRDLLFEVPYFDNAPSFDLSDDLNGMPPTAGSSVFNHTAQSNGGNSGNYVDGRSGRDGIFDDGGPDPKHPNREELVDRVIDVLMQTIDREGWVDFGGDTGVVQELSGNLIITQTPRNHRSIQGLLSQLREIRAIQINMESRFLAVDMDWFEQIGFDLDLYFNTNSDLFQAARAIDPFFQLGDFFGPNGQLIDPLNTYPTIGAGPSIRATDGFTPYQISQNSSGLTNLLGGFAGDSFAGTIISAAHPALVTGIQFLDDIQVDLLVEATQADRRNVVLTAPRLSLFNGQRSWVLVGTQQAIVSGLIPIVGDNSGAFQPLLSTLIDGVVLDVEAVVSADRRYVTLTVVTGIRETVNIETLEFGGAAGGGGIIGGGGQAGEFTGSISLPEVEVTIVNTSASVPDRGTLLIGGQRIVDETELEVGVPILSKIPFINRFFTNRVSSRQEQTLLILLRPEIIIQQENEDLLFPGLTDMLGQPF